MGYSLSGLVFSSMLEGCKVDTSDDWIPEFFSKEQLRTIGALADHILPDTDTPSATALYVDRFIDNFVRQCFTKENQERFISGLNNFQSFANETVGTNFEKATASEKDKILELQEAIPFIIPREVWGRATNDPGETPFYRQFKGLCLFGYFSTETIGETVLNYDPLPGKFIGCIPLSEVGNAWSL